MPTTLETTTAPPATERDPAQRTRYFGRRMPRPGDDPLLRGEAKYVGDLHPEGVLHVALVRSPYPHAMLESIDAAVASSLPGVVLVATGRDIHPEHPPLHTILAADINSPDRPLLAVEKAKFAGEAVVAVVAESRYVAEDAAALVDIRWRPFPPVTDPSEALGESAALIHDDVPGNRYARRQLDVGDVEAALAAAELVIEREVVHPRISGAPMECRGVLAVPHGTAMTVWLSSQNPHSVHEAIVRVLGIAAEDLNVIVPEVGGAFGLKGHVYPEDILVPWLALKVNRPVRWLEDRSEHMQCSNHSRDQRVQIRAGFTRDGRLLGLAAKVTSDVGAYGVHPMGPLLDVNTCSGLIPGPYDLRNYSFDSSAVATNKAPGGAFRGVGMTTAVLTHERMMDIAAHELAIDPAEIRRRNFIPPQSMPYTTTTGHPYESGDFTAALETALAAFGYEQARAEQREARGEDRAVGIGIASYVEVTAGGSRTFVGRGMVDVHAVDSARIRLAEGGRIRVQSTCPDLGQGSNTTFAQVAAEILGVDIELVTVEHTDTAQVPLGFGTGMSRSSVAGATGVERAAAQLREVLLETASSRLGVDDEELTVRGDAICRIDDGEAAITLAELAAAIEEEGGVPVVAEATYDPVQASHPFATHVCMVEVNRDTGHVELLRYVVAEDCGRVINPLIVDGQIHGGSAQGIASALLEELRYSEDGQLLTASFMDYLLPTAWDVPTFEIRHMETPSTNHQLGTKGAGEGGTIAAPAAIANAVADALGVEVNRLPVSPQRVLELLEQRSEVMSG
jgi:aerobic carbon-monoxide dehydrogenase large subunit